MQVILLIVVGFVGLTILVTIHEWGHFLAARWAKVDVEAFAVGWGKVLWKWKPGQTEYRICLLPLGGYCKMKGEQDLLLAMQSPDGAFEPSPGSLYAVSPWKRIVISVAGPLFNLILAVLLLSVLALTGVPEIGPGPKVQLASQVDGGAPQPADRAGMKSGDTILAIDGKAVRNFRDIQKIVGTSDGRTLSVQVARDDGQTTLAVTPDFHPSEQRSVVGIYPWVVPTVETVAGGSAGAIAGFKSGDLVTAVNGHSVDTSQDLAAQLRLAHGAATVVTVRRDGQSQDLNLIVDEAAGLDVGLGFALPHWQAVGQPLPMAITSGYQQTADLLGQMLQGLGLLFTGQVDPTKSLSGPLRITYYVGEVASQGFLAGWGEGWSSVTNFLAFLSLALFLMNLLPIPALDGGTIVVALWESIRRRRLSIKALMRYQQIGVVLILGLVLFTTVNDLGFLFTLK